MDVQKSPLGFPTQGQLYCPRCDRVFITQNEKRIDTIERLKKHVALQHPDHDPEWFDTYPHGKEETIG